MIPKNIPQDIRIESLLSYYPKGKCKIRLGGQHKRNTYHDLVDLVEGTDDTMQFTIGRNSLYHILPEYLFHPVDRFADSLKTGDQDDFQQAYEAQEKETEDARRFFAPLDLMLLLLRVELWEKLSDYTKTDKVVIDMIGDRLTEKQKQNRFIRQFMPFLPSCRNIRGDRTMLSLLLRKVFLTEDLHIEAKSVDHEFADPSPRYRERLSGDADPVYLGNTFQEQVTTYTIHYWSEGECNENFPEFLDEIEELRGFIQDYFIAVDEILRFEVVKDGEPVLFSGGDTYNYLNHNTNL